MDGYNTNQVIVDELHSYIGGFDRGNGDEEEECRTYPPLNPPLSIELRIRAAIAERLPYQVVHYARREGATQAIINIAMGNKDIVVMANGLLKRRYEGCNFIPSNSNLIEGIRRKIVLMDVVAPTDAHRAMKMLSIGGENRIIEIKGVYYDEYQETYCINGVPLVKGTTPPGSKIQQVNR